MSQTIECAFKALAENPYAFNFANRRLWLIVSKAFERSINKAETYVPLSIVFQITQIVFQIARNKNVVNVIPNENTTFIFEFSEFEFSKFECFGSTSHLLITVLLAWTHKKAYINMASISSKKWEAGKLKRCLTINEKIKLYIGWSKEKKLSCRAIAEEFKTGKTQAVSVVRNEAKFREKFEHFQGKGFKHIKRENHQMFKPINDISLFLV